MTKQTKAVYTIVNGKKGNSDKSYWNRIGSAFVNKDGSLNVVLNAFPVDGRLHIRDAKPSAGTRPSAPSMLSWNVDRTTLRWERGSLPPC